MSNTDDGECSSSLCDDPFNEGEVVVVTEGGDAASSCFHVCCYAQHAASTDPPTPVLWAKMKGIRRKGVKSWMRMRLPGAFMSRKRSGKSRSKGKGSDEEDSEEEVLSPGYVLLDGSGGQGPATRMSRTTMPPWDVEDRASGKINCPSGAHGIIVNLRACNLQMCYGCIPWVGFCFYCKQVLHDGIACSSCHHRVSLSHIQELASNDAVKSSSENDEDDEDEDEDEDADDDEKERPAKRTRRCARKDLQSKGEDNASAIDVDDSD